MNLSIVTGSKLVNEMVGQVAKQVSDAKREQLCEDHLMQAMGEPKKKQGQSKQQATITGNGKFLNIRAIK